MCSSQVEAVDIYTQRVILEERRDPCEGERRSEYIARRLTAYYKRCQIKVSLAYIIHHKGACAQTNYLCSVCDEMLDACGSKYI